MRLHLSACVLSDDDDVTALLRRALADAGFTEAARDVDGVVVAAPLPAPSRLTDLDLPAWIEAAEQPLAAGFGHLLEARRRLRDGRGRIVLVAPTIGVAGAAELVALTTVGEGLRAMAKSAARQWAAEGVLVNTLVVPLEVLRPSTAPLTQHLAPPAVAAPDGAAIGAMLAMAMQAPAALVGATISLDGGSVMAP